MLDFISLGVFNQGTKEREKNEPLAPVAVILVLQLLHAYFHSILGEDNVASLHLLPGVLAHILDDAVCDIADDGQDNDYNDEDDERDKAWSRHLGRCRQEIRIESAKYRRRIE